jgi:hypothetical protein
VGFVLPLMVIVPMGVPVYPYIVWGDRFIWELDTSLGVLPEYFSDSFLPCPTSFTMSSSTTLRVVTTDVGRRPCPIPYPRRIMPLVQSRVPGSDNGSEAPAVT